MNPRILLPVLSIVVLLLCLPISADDAAKMTLDQVLAANYEARGGETELKAVDTLVMTGTMNMGGAEAPFTITAKRPGKVRMEFTMQGMTGVQAYDGEIAWMVMPFMGTTDPQEVPADQAKSIIEMGDFDGPLVDWKDKGHQVELVGVEEIEGTEAYKLKVTMSNGDVRNHYLDSEAFITIKQDGKSMAQGVEVEFETTLSDYKEVAGLMFPHSFESRAKGAPAGQVITVNEITVNPEISDDVFVMPEKEKSTEEGE